ncbi:YciI family protein [Olivibacter sp. SDN3]|uniref:YciI family protein n=1 Tax=Olivibacter sp. SDN3 TaxID=2764720 RepID=UPI0021052190|nr:YciI family protein [Olivibacter sp. SDN3]
MLLFRMPNDVDDSEVTPEEWEKLGKKWGDWVGGIAAQGKVVSTGPRLEPTGKVLKKSGVVTDGPFVEVREILGGFLRIKADSLDEATTLAHGCPAIDQGGSVEIRPVYVQP